jgi:hypothetical protein
MNTGGPSRCFKAKVIGLDRGELKKVSTKYLERRLAWDEVKAR